MKKILYTIILFMILIVMPALAQVNVTNDTLPNTGSTDSTAVLNNNLRLNQNAINAIGGYFNSNGFLLETSGGTGTNLSIVPNGSILVQNASNVGIGTINPGTSGQILTSNGAGGVNPSFQNVPPNTFRFISKTSPSAATNSGDIAITRTNYYLVTMSISTLSAADSISVIFNNVSTASYGYVYKGTDTNNVAISGNAALSGAAATYIQLCPSMKTSSGTSVNSYFYLFPQNGTSKYMLSGSTAGQVNATSEWGSMSTFGVADIGAVTSFRVITTGSNNMTGDINVYQIQQQQENL